MREKLWFSYQSFASGPSLIGLVVGVFRIVLPFWIFFHLLEQIRGCFCLFVSSFPLFTTVNSLCFSCYSFINNISSYLSKEKKHFNNEQTLKKKKIYIVEQNQTFSVSTSVTPSHLGIYFFTHKEKHHIICRVLLILCFSSASQTLFNGLYFCNPHVKL